MKNSKKPVTVQPAQKERAFWGYKPHTQRIRVAKDVIAQLNAKTIEAASDSYLNANELVWNEDVKLREKFDVAFNRVAKEYKKLEDAQPLCYCCAIGACFIAVARLGDRITVGKVDDAGSTAMKKFMNKVFSRDQLELMEMAFEGSNISDNPSFTSEQKIIANYFRNQFDDDEDERLRIIMENLIANKGIFVIEDLAKLN